MNATRKNSVVNRIKDTMRLNYVVTLREIVAHTNIATFRLVWNAISTWL